MSDPMRELEAAIQSGRFHHDGNSLMTWCIGNVIGKNLPGNDDVVRPVKESADQKIDGAVALIMASARSFSRGPGKDSCRLKPEPHWPKLQCPFLQKRRRSTHD
jgi:hypothetical protein